MAAQTGIKLLSSLRKTKSKSALHDTPRHFFAIEEEQLAFDWLADFVEQHNSWPTPDTVLRETGIQTVVTNEPLEYYRDRARKHALWEAGMPLFKKMREAFGDSNADDAMLLAEQMLSVRNEFSRAGDRMVTLASSIGMVVADYETAKRTPGLRGIPTGYAFADEMTDGMQNANLYTTVARSGRGKTFKLLKQALAAHNAGYSVLFLTNEMGVLQVARRFFGMQTCINPRFLREGRLSTAVEREMRRQAAQLEESDAPPFYWLAGEHGNSVEKLKAAAYQAGPDLIIADASYLMKPSDRNKLNARHEIIGNVMQGLHALSISLDRPISQSVQFNRLAVTPKSSSNDEEDRNNPLSHMGLEKIAGSDEIGQLSAYVEGLDLGPAPHQDDERYAGVLKGREGENGWYKYHHKFQPLNMEQIMDHRDQRGLDNGRGAAPDMSFMDADV